MREAPVFTRAYDVTAWLLQRFEGSDALSRAIQASALRLLESVTLALKGVDRTSRVRDADEADALLRVHVRLANTLGSLDDRRLLYVTEELDEIGRQIGGWMRSLDAPENRTCRHRGSR